MSASAISNYTYNNPAASTAVEDASTVSKDEFLKLLVTQLTNQDPLSPMQDIDFTAQLAQLQALEEQISLNQSMQALRLDTQMQAGSAMIGLKIAGTDTLGAQTEGIVQNTLVKDGTVYLVLDNDKHVAVSDVTSTASMANSSDLLASAAGFVGMFVSGTAADGKTEATGIVESVALDANGRVVLKLYGGESVPVDNIAQLRAATDAEVFYYLPDELRAEAETAQRMVDQYVTVGTVDVSGAAVQRSGVVRDAFLSGDKVVLTLHDGFSFGVGDIVKYDAPTTEQLDEAAANYVGQYFKGADADGDEVEGLVASASWTDTDEAMVFTLHDGTEVRLGDADTVRNATDAERLLYLGGADAGDDA